MKNYYHLFLVALLFSCQPRYASIFDEACNCDPIKFENGSLIQDSLGEYHLKAFESWNPIRKIRNGHSMIILGDSVNGALSAILTDLHPFKSDWVWEQ